MNLAIKKVWTNVVVDDNDIISGDSDTISDDVNLQEGEEEINPTLRSPLWKFKLMI